MGDAKALIHKKKVSQRADDEEIYQTQLVENIYLKLFKFYSKQPNLVKENNVYFRLTITSIVAEFDAKGKKIKNLEINPIPN